MGRRFVEVILSLLIAFFGSRTASAEPYTILPNGDLIFNVELTTHGTFTCGSVVPCSGSGTDAVTISSGAGTATFTFTGVSLAISVGNVAVPVTLATITGSSTPGFTVPSTNPYVPVFSLTWSVAHTSPLEAENSLTWGISPSPSLARLGGGTYIPMPGGPTPPQYHYFIAYDELDLRSPLDPNGMTTIVGHVGAAPEPASMVLLGSGLAGLAFGRRRRRRKDTPQ